MATITTHEAKTHLSRYLSAVEKGEEFLIARGRKVVAKLGPVDQLPKRSRPKAGKILGAVFEFPDSAFAPMTAAALKEWGL